MGIQRSFYGCMLFSCPKHQTRILKAAMLYNKRAARLSESTVELFLGRDQNARQSALAQFLLHTQTTSQLLQYHHEAKNRLGKVMLHAISRVALPISKELAVTQRCFLKPPGICCVTCSTLLVRRRRPGRPLRVLLLSYTSFCRSIVMS